MLQMKQLPGYRVSITWTWADKDDQFFPVCWKILPPLVWRLYVAAHEVPVHPNCEHISYVLLHLPCYDFCVTTVKMIWVLGYTHWASSLDLV